MRARAWYFCTQDVAIQIWNQANPLPAHHLGVQDRAGFITGLQARIEALKTLDDFLLELNKLKANQAGEEG